MRNIQLKYIRMQSNSVITKKQINYKNPRINIIRNTSEYNKNFKNTLITKLITTKNFL